MDLTALDWIMLHADQARDLLASHGLQRPRVVGWAGAGSWAPSGVPAEIEVDLPEVTDLTGGDLARLGRELSELVGVEIVVWASPPGESRVLPGERVRYL